MAGCLESGVEFDATFTEEGSGVGSAVRVVCRGRAAAPSATTATVRERRRRGGAPSCQVRNKTKRVIHLAEGARRWGFSAYSKLDAASACVYSDMTEELFFTSPASGGLCSPLLIISRHRH